MVYRMGRKFGEFQPKTKSVFPVDDSKRKGSKEFIALQKSSGGLAVGMTFFRLSERYGMEEFCSEHRRQLGSRNIFNEFDEFRKGVCQCETVMDMMKQYSSHNGDVDPNDMIKSEAERLTQEFNQEDHTDSIKHLHAKRGGKGAMIIWGVQIGNVFQVLMIDPNHESV